LGFGGISHSNQGLLTAIKNKTGYDQFDELHNVFWFLIETNQCLSEKNCNCNTVKNVRTIRIVNITKLLMIKMQSRNLKQGLMLMYLHTAMRIWLAFIFQASSFRVHVKK
jgi:hypothetical protein